MGRHVETLAPTLRLGLGATGSTTARSPGDGHEAPVVRQPDPEPVVPILDADELADVLSQLIEEAADPVEVERSLEAVARLAGSKPRSGGDVLARRAQTLLGERDPGPWTGEDVRADLAALTLVWLARGSVGHGPQGRVVDHQLRSNRYVSIFSPDWTLSSLVTMRIHEIATATAKGGATLLSLPTRRDGSIDRAAIQERVRSLSRTARPLPLDVGVAALRLSPADDSELDLPGAHRAARALVAHLETLESHHARWEPVLGTSRGMYGPTLERGATWRDAASSKGGTTDAVAAVLDRHDPLRRFGLETQDGEYGGRFEQVTALWPLLLPHHPELLAAHAHARLNRALTKNRNGTGPLIDALARTGTPTGPVVCSALTLGLSAKNGDERTRAVDALVDLAAAGLLDGDQLGAQIQRLLEADIVTGSRVASSLLDADRAGPAAAGPILDALQALLPALPGRRDAHLFVDLTAQLATRQGRTITLPDAFTRLRKGTSSSGLAAAVQRLPIR